jgi:predicted outer membrane protein
MHLIVAALLVAPWVTAKAQDTTTTPKQDSTQQKSAYTTDTQSNQSQSVQEPLSDEAVLMKLHRANQHEIKLAQLAQKNGTSKVKSFAQRLVKDHNANDQKVTALARTMGVSLQDSTQGQYQGQRYGQRDTTQQRSDSAYPQTYRQGGDSTRMQGADPTKHHDMQDDGELARQLQSLHGAAFDTAFANAMVQGHEKALSMLEQAQSQVQNSQLATLITSTLPTIRQHLQIAQSLGGSATTTSSSQQ